MTNCTLLQKWQMLEAVTSDRSLSPSEMLVAFKLLGRLNTRTGQCNPSYSTIAEDTGFDRRSVMRMVKKLDAKGWLIRSRRDGTGSLPSNDFAFNWAMLDGDRGVTTSLETGDTPVTTLVTGGPPYSDTPVTNDGDPGVPPPGDRGVTLIRERTLIREIEHGNGIWESNTEPRASRSSPDDIDQDGKGPSVEEHPESLAGTPSSIEGELFPPGADCNVPTNSDSARAREVAPSGRRKPPAYTSAEIERMFSAFWFQYPKKEGRGGAKKAFERIVKARKVMPDEIMNGAMRYAATKIDTDPQFIKGPAKWLNDECWTDETPAPRAAGFAPRRNNSADDMMRAFLNLGNGDAQ